MANVHNTPSFQLSCSKRPNHLERILRTAWANCVNSAALGIELEELEKLDGCERSALVWSR